MFWNSNAEDGRNAAVCAQKCNISVYIYMCVEKVIYVSTYIFEEIKKTQ